MRFMKRLFIALVLILFTYQSGFCADVWVNDLRKLFLDNSAIIYEINLRTFNAQDTNKNGIIDFDEAEESGTFLNAIARLDELQANSITAVHLLPITPVGKTKALGTAGSLYSALGSSGQRAKVKLEIYIDTAGYSTGVRTVYIDIYRR